jgi:hypothetical protein
VASLLRRGDSGNAIAGRSDPSQRSREPNHLANGGIAATAELASVERCSAPVTRPPHTAAPPPCSVPAWSGVQATLPPPIGTSNAAVDRVPQEHCHTRTQRVAGRDGGGGPEKDTPSGSEHGSTVASTVAACGNGQIARTNVTVQPVVLDSAATVC